MATAAAIYVRVSSDGQEENYSLPSQIEACQRYAQQQGFAVVGVFQDVMSGSILERPALDKVRALVRAGDVGAVIVYALDRLTRNVAHSYVLRDELKRARVALHYVTRGASADTAEGNLFETMDAAFAEYERLKIAERMARGRKQKIASGKLLGCGVAPYGYRWGGTAADPVLIADPEQAAVVRMIFDWYTVERMGMGRIVQQLHAMGIPTARGGDARWGVARVRDILCRSIYVGVYVANYYSQREDVVRTEGKVERIISDEQFELAQQVRATNQRFSRGNRKHPYLLAHRIRTERIGMSGVTIPNKYGQLFRYYIEFRAVRDTGEKQQRVAADRIEQAVWAALVQMLSPDVVRDGLTAYRQQQQGDAEARQQQIATLERERATLEARHRKLIAAYEKDAITLDDLRDSKERTTLAVASIDRELARLQQAGDRLMTPEQERAAIALVQQMYETLGDLDDEDKQAVLDALDVKVKVLDCSRKHTTFEVSTLIGMMQAQEVKGQKLHIVYHNLRIS